MDEPVYRSSNGELRVGNTLILGFNIDGVGRCVFGSDEMLHDIMQVLQKYDPQIAPNVEIKIIDI
jgi:hypothetical protein